MLETEPLLIASPTSPGKESAAPAVELPDGLEPLSPAQERMWLLYRLQPPELYNAYPAYRLLGNLDAEALEMALGLLVARHESLRSSFVEIDGRPYRAVQDFVPLELRRLDSGANEEELLEAEARTPFDLTVAPLIRATLLRRSADEHVLSLCLHHIVYDGWSEGVLLRDLSELYRAVLAAERPALLPVQARYSDYVADQLTQDNTSALAYWRQQLHGSATIDLPQDSGRTASTTVSSGLERWVVPEETVVRLRQISRQSKTSLPMVLLAVYAAFLARQSGQTDITVGMPVGGRSRVEYEGLVGLFLNSLAIRCDLSGDPSLRQLIERVSTVALDAYDHQRLPLEQVVAELVPEREPGKMPLFQHFFSFNSAGAGRLQFPGVKAESLPRSPLAQFDLSFDVAPREQDGGLDLVLIYSDGLFSAERAARWRQDLEMLIGALGEDADRLLSSLPAPGAGPNESEEALHGERRALEPAGLREQLAYWAAETPDSQAVIAEGESLTFAELYKRANQLAHHLQERGVGVDDVIAICLERSVEMVVAMFGVLQAGAAYLPLDPDYPSARLEYMLRDSGARTLIGDSRFLGRLPSLTEVRPMLIDSERAAIAAQPETPPAASVHPDNLAYLIYTSGSTGQPKGAALTQGAILNHMHWVCDLLSLSPDDRILQRAPFSFDASVWELLMPVFSGGAMVLAAAGRQGEPAYLARLMAAERVTVLQSVPAVLGLLLDEPELFSCCSSLRYVLSGGDRLPANWASRFYDLLPEAQLVNLWGPTETCIDASSWMVPLDAAAGFAGEPALPLGRALWNTDIYLLDGALVPVPAGAAGEIYIAGPQLARGYSGMPALTAERFRPNPFGPPGSRLYRSGDRGRLKGGLLLFLGRSDHQVKIRGFRVELGEIEAELVKHPAVGQAVAAVKEDPRTGSPLLVAYVVSADGYPSPAADELLRFLESSLPEYMRPQAFVFLKALPLGPSNKLDRKQLPEPAFAAALAGAAPQTPVEQVVANVYAEVLGAAQVSRDDDFFQLGGHSLLAPQVMSRLGKVLGVNLGLRTVFENPQVSALAEVLVASGATVSEPEEPGIPERDDEMISLASLPLAEVGPLDEAPLSFQQESLYLFKELHPDNSHNIPYTFRLRGPFSEEVFQRALDSVVAQHPGLRTRFITRNGAAFQQIVPGLRVLIKSDDLSGAPLDLEEASQRLSREAKRPFDFAVGPPFRVVLLRLAADDHLLLLAFPHIVTDGGSSDVILNELALAYRSLANGSEPKFESEAVRYTDYALWQRLRFEAGELEDDFAYWRKQLADVPRLDPPTDRPRQAQESYLGRVVSFTIEPEVGLAVRERAQEMKVTSFVFLLSALAALLSRLYLVEDVAIGSSVSGRREWELERVVGYFINLAVLRADLSGDPSFGELVTRLRDTALEAFEHDLPFEQIVSDLKPERGSAHALLSQILFNFRETDHVDTIDLPDVVCERFPIDLELVAPPASFDLNIALDALADGRLEMHLHGREDLFEPATLTRFCRHYRTILKAILADHEQPLSQLPLNDEEERQQLLSRGRAPVAVAAPDLLESFAAIVSLQPDAPALSLPGGELVSYSSLDRASDRLATELAASGVGPERGVVVCLERGQQLVESFLAILKAGGVFIPLDPGLPDERLAGIVAQVKPVLLILEDGAERVGDIPVLQKRSEGATTLLAHFPAMGDNLAYVVFTSGSTGEPKGVAVSRQALGEAIASLGAEIALAPGDRLPLLSSTFDVALMQLGLALTAGAELVLTGDAHPVAYLADGPDITALLVSPSVISQIEDRHQQLRTIVVGGETCSDALADTWGAGRRFLNCYGPAETALNVTAGERQEAGAPSIGRPLGRTAAYVLDERLELVPVGIPGELYLGGPQLARGYLGRPAETAAAFLPDPFSVDGGRLYRSGDLVRWSNSAELEFLGRADRQVKIRGFRVELQEVESALDSYPELVTAAVVAEQGEQSRLLAYVVPAVGYSERELRAHLRGRLPDYMIPAVFTPLEALPLLGNGKVDELSLPTPRTSGDIEEYLAPVSDAELVVCQVWAEVLGLERVSANSSFFDLGGDSLLSLRVVAAITEAGYEIGLAQVLEGRTAAELAEVLRPRVEAEAIDERTAADGLTISQERFFGLSSTLPEPAFYNLGGFFTAKVPLDIGTLELAVADLMSTHPALRAVFNDEDGRWRQHYLEVSARRWLERIDLTASSDPDGDWQTLAQSRQRSLLLDSQLTRFILADLPRGQELLLICHHLVVDLYSLGTVLADLEKAYRARAAGAVTALSPAMPIFAVTAEQTETSSGPPALLPTVPLPVDHDLGPGRLADECNVDLRLSPADLESLQSEAKSAGVELPAVLLGALGQAVSTWAGGPVAIGQMRSGREQGPLDLSRTCGWLAAETTLVLGEDDSLDFWAQARQAEQALAGEGVTPIAAAQLGFNFVGRLSPGESGASELFAWHDDELLWHHPDESRFYLLEALALQDADGLLLRLVHGPAHDRETVERVRDQVLARLHSAYK